MVCVALLSDVIFWMTCAALFCPCLIPLTAQVLLSAWSVCLSSYLMCFSSCLIIANCQCHRCFGFKNTFYFSFHICPVSSSPHRYFHYLNGTFILMWILFRVDLRSFSVPAYMSASKTDSELKLWLPHPIKLKYDFVAALSLQLVVFFYLTDYHGLLLNLAIFQ